MKLFKQKVDLNKIEDFDKLPKKRKEDALKLLEEYKKGLVIKPDADVDHKELFASIRKGE